MKLGEPYRDVANNCWHLPIMDELGHSDAEITICDAGSDELDVAMVAQMQTVLNALDTVVTGAIVSICEARIARLNWLAGPPVDDWSLIEVLVTPERETWLLLQEYETDEYSVWAVRLEDEALPAEVWRAPWKAPLGLSVFETGQKV